jgi:iron complex outermembrane receptor protein
MDQNIAEANFQGGLFNLPAGEVRGAVGVGWRENTFEYQVDILASSQSFTDGVIGLFPAGNTVGSDEVKEAYAELLVPVVADVPGFKRLNLELGYRFSDYDRSGSVDTYKALLDWTIVDAVRFRGGYQRANRAPNIGEFFLPQTQAVQGTAFGDPCARNSTAPYGANAAANPGGFQAARNLCTAIMGAPAAAVFYDPAATVPPTFFPFVTVTNQGNLNLKSEEADTYTAGFVFRPAFDSPLLSRFTASLDWYSIEIQDAIAALTFDAIYGQCINPANNPSLTPTGNPFCSLISRDPGTGTPAVTLGSFQNVGTFETSGIDLNIDWSADFADMGLASVPGALSVNLATTYLDKYETQDVAGAPVLDFAGTVGPVGASGNNAAQFRYKTFTTLGYSVGGVSANLRWRHLPSARAASFPANPVTPFEGPSHYDIVDLSANWEISQTYQVRFGVENVFDTDPEITNARVDATPNSGQGITLPGYYDVLGRRYFVGFKARF